MKSVLQPGSIGHGTDRWRVENANIVALKRLDFAVQ